MIIAIFITVIVVFFAIYHASNTGERVAELKRHYDQQLQGTDKRAALNAGRAYYSALRKNGELTIYDEQAIQNDLMTMQ